MNLRRKQTSILLTISLAIIATIGGVVAYRVFDAELEEATKSDYENHQKTFASTSAKNIERYFYDIQKRMEIIAQSPVVRDSERSEACNQNLQNILEVNRKELNNLGRINKNGVFECAVNRTIIGEPASKYGNYFETIANDPQHKPVMSPLIFPSGGATGVIAVHVPVYDSNGQFNGTIGGAVYFDELQNQILSGVQLSPNSIVALYDKNLDILSNPDPLLRGKNLLSEDVLSLYTPREKIKDFANKIKAPAEGTITYSFRDVKRQAVYKSVPVIGRHWTILIAVPEDDIR